MSDIQEQPKVVALFVCCPLMFLKLFAFLFLKSVLDEQG
jgi:hypothetical protein